MAAKTHTKISKVLLESEFEMFTRTTRLWIGILCIYLQVNIVFAEFTTEEIIKSVNGQPQIENKSYYKGEEILSTLKFARGTVFYTISDDNLKPYFCYVNEKDGNVEVVEALAGDEIDALTSYYKTYMYGFAVYDRKIKKRLENMKVFWAGQGRWGRGDWNHLRLGHQELRDRKLFVFDTNTGNTKEVRPGDYGISLKNLNKNFLMQLRGKNIDGPSYLDNLTDVMRQFQSTYLENHELRKQGLLPLGIVDDAALTTNKIFIGFVIPLFVLGVGIVSTWSLKRMRNRKKHSMVTGDRAIL